MHNDLTEQLKDRMSYTEDAPPKCEDCFFVKESTDQAGSSVYTCYLNPALTLPVREFGRCLYFKTK